MIDETPKKVLDANLFLKQLSDMQKGSVVDTEPAVIPKGHSWDSPESNLSSQPTGTDIETTDQPPTHPWDVPQPDISSLRTKASETRDALTSASEKLENSYLGKYKLPQQYIAPMGASSNQFESKEQEEAYKDFRDKQLKLKQAIRYLNRAINTPGEKKGAAIKAFQNELHNIASAGVSGMLENIITATSAKQLASGEPNEANDALIDAYGQLQQLTGIANKEVTRYRRASSVAGSIPYMEQFLLTGGIGTGAAGVAKTAGQAITKKILNKTIQGGVKRLIEPVIEGAVSMVGRVPLSPATYGNIAESSIGELSQNQQGQYVIDEKNMPSMFEAIGSGTYSSAKEIFTESLGGMVAVPKGILPNVLNRAISPGVKKFFKAAGMNNPLGEYYEEIISNVLGGDKVDKEFLVDLLFTIPVITGGFSVFSAPSVINNMKIRSDRMGVIKTFGKDRVSEIENMLDNPNVDNPEAVIDLMTKLSEDFDNKDIGKLFNYAASRVQERASRELQNQQTTDVPLVNTSTGPLTVPTDETTQPEEITVPKTPEEMDLEVEKHFQPLKENMEKRRNKETGDIDTYQQVLKGPKEKEDKTGQKFHLLYQVDDDTGMFISAETEEGEPDVKEMKSLSNMELLISQKYENWVKNTKDNLRMGLQVAQQAQETEAAKPEPTPENSYKEEIEAFAANPEAQPEDIQAIRDRVTDDMVNGVQFSDEFLQQLEITKPEVPAETEAAPVVEPKVVQIVLNDEKLPSLNAIEQPNGTLVVENTFSTKKEAEKIQNAFNGLYEDDGYKAFIEPKYIDKTNPLAGKMFSIRITKSVSVVSPEKEVVTKEPVQEGEENERVQAALDKASKPKRGWPMSNADKELIAQDPASFSMAVYQFFLRGGRVKTSDLNDYLGKEITDEGGNPYIWAIANDGISLDVINQLPDFEQFMAGMEGMDGINAFMEVLKGVGSKQIIRDKLNTMLGNQEAPAPTDEEIAEQQNTDADETIAEISETIEVNPKILPIFMEYLDLDGNIEWDKLATQAEKDPFWFTEFPFNLTQAEFDELSNILTDDNKKRSIEEWYKTNGIAQIKTQGDELFPRGEQPEGGTGSQVDQGQPGVSQEVTAAQPTAKVTPPDEEPPGEELPETTKQLEIAGKFPHYPEGTRIMRTDGTGPKKIYYDGLTLGGAFVMLREGDPQSDKVQYITPEELSSQFTEYVKPESKPASEEKPTETDKNRQKVSDETKSPEEISKEADFRDKMQEVIKEKLDKPQFAGDVLKPTEPIDKPVDNLTEKEQQLAQEEAKVDTEPTEEQIKAGNYQKGHISIQGMDISIENPKGSVRKGTDQNGKKWEQEMQNSYGYFPGTKGADTQEGSKKKDWIDVFIGPNLESPNVFIIDQVNPETREFDEHKVLLGFDNEQGARDAYLSNYEDNWQGLGAITGMPVDEFKTWLYDGKAKTKPVAYKESAKVETDPARIQEIKNSIAEGEMILKSGKKISGEKMTPEELSAVQKSVDNSKAKLGEFVKEGDVYSDIRPKLDDIPYQLAYNAYRNMSFSPEKKAESKQKEYFDQVNAVIEEMDKIAKSPEQKAILIPEIERYKKGLIDKTNAYLSASSRTASPMITGPANFPVDRNRKAMNTLDKRRTELIEWDKKAQAAIKKAISIARTPEQYKSDKWNSIKDVLDDKIATIVSIDKGENKYTMRNLVVSNLKGFIDRIAKNGQVDDTRQVLDYVKEVQSKLTKPIFTDRNAVWNNVSVAEEMQKRKQKLSTITPAYSQIGATGEYLVQKHSISGEELHTIRLTEQVSPEEFQQFKTLARRLGGHWSSYRKEGMLPGFMFKSKENADRFKTYLDNDMVTEPDMVYEDLFGNRTPIQSRMNFDFQPQLETTEKDKTISSLKSKLSAIEEAKVKKPAKTREATGEFSLIEVKSRTDGGMFFNGSVTTTSPQDVAFLVRNLQTASVENVIIVGIKQDDTPLIYHHSTGSVAGAVVEPTQIARFLHENDFKESYMVHNHPSGSPQPSPSDYKIAATLRKIEESGGKKITFIINDVDTGIFTIFDPVTSTHEEFQELSEKDYIEKGIETKDYEVLKFDRIAFAQDVEFFKPAKGISEERPSGRIVPKIKSSKDVAAFVSAMRFSTGEKLGVLILDKSNAIVANYFIPLEWDSDKMFYELSGMVGRHNGQGVIFYDNNSVKPELSFGRSATEIKVSEVFNKADGKSPSSPGHVFSVLDYISAPVSPDINVRYSEQYISRANQGLMEPETPYKPKPILDLEKRITDTENRIIETVKQKAAKEKELDDRLHPKGDKFAGDLFAPVQKRAFDIAMDNSPENIQRIITSFDNTLARLRDELKGLKNQLSTAIKENAGEQDLFEGVSEPGATMWPEVVNGFYSPIEKRLAEFKQDKASVNKWKEIIGKGDEAEFTGVLGWMNSLKPDQQLRKSEVSQWMKDNRIEIKEIIHGKKSGGTIPKEVISALKSLDYLGYDNASAAMSGIRQSPDTWKKDWDVSENDEVEKVIDDYVSIGLTKFAQDQYLTTGEKSDYKEILVTLPVKKTYSIQEGFNGRWNIINERGKIEQFADSKEQAEVFKDRFDELASGKKQFKSKHFDEPNILVHLRMNTRTDSEGKKVLFLEEIQSDWGQKGKKEGFAIPMNPEEAKQKVKEIHEKVINGELSQEEAIPLIENYTKNISTIPVAPFVTDTNAWVKLGLKVALKEAVRQDVDRIAWTTGEQQNDRYDLSKQVKDVTISKNKDGSYEIDATPITGETRTEIASSVPQNKLADYIGKDLATKAINEVTGEAPVVYTGENLKVGGSGMIGFYGSPSENKPGIIGNIAKSLTKQEPKAIDIQTHTLSSLDEPKYTPDGIVLGKRRKSFEAQHSIDITPALRAETEKGLPMFMKGKEKQFPLTIANQEHADYVKGIINDLQTKAPGAAKSIVVTRYADLPDILQKNGESVNDIAGLTPMIKSTIKSFHALYSPNTDTSYFIAEGMEHDKDYVIEAWLHEQIGHKGIRLLFPNIKERVAFLEGLHDFTGQEAIDKILRDRGYLALMKAEEAEEYIAFLTGELIDGRNLTMKERSVWQKILDWFRSAWNKITGKKVSGYDAARVIHAMLTKVMAPAEAVGLKLYHGSAQEFNSFSTDKVNTGMGSMNHGFGNYLNSEKQIGEYWASQVTSQSAYFKQARIDLADNNLLLERALHYSKGSNEGIVKWLQDKVSTYSDDPRLSGKYKSVLNYLDKNPLPPLKYLYVVTVHGGRIPGDWDYMEEFKTITTDQINKINEALRKEEGQEVNRMTGRMVYRKLSDILGSDRLATEFLLRANIDGMTYENDNISGEVPGGVNYVVFDDSQIVIDQHVAFIKVKRGNTPPPIQFAGDMLKNASGAYLDVKKKRSINETLQGIREYIQDMSLPVRKMEEEILKNGGIQDDNSKPYRDMSLAFGRQEHLYNSFFDNKFKPILTTVSKIRKRGVPGEFILPYIIAKHAMERNPAFRARELKEWSEKHSLIRDNWIENNPDATKGEINQRNKDFEESLENKELSIKNKDYSGVLPFDKDGSFANPDELAKAIVEEFENSAPEDIVTELWNNMSATSSSILDIWVAGQQISPEQRQAYIDQFKYFVPLRGFREGAAKDLAYTQGSGTNRSLIHAEGRASLADNPLAYILKTTFGAIGEQVDNEIKTSMLNFLMLNKGNAKRKELVNVKMIYYLKVELPDGTIEWEPTLEKPDDTLIANGDAKFKIWNEHERLRSSAQAKEHEVKVSRQDVDVIMVFSDKALSAAQSLNKQNYMYHSIFGNIKDAREWNKTMSEVGQITNFMKATFTQWNVVFPFTNFARDVQEASITQFIKGDKPWAVARNYSSAFPALFRHIVGKQDMNQKMDQILYQFYDVGGATGFTHSKTPEQLEKELNKEVDRMISEGSFIGFAKAIPRNTLKTIAYWNMIFEDATRFSVYLAAIRKGMTERDAASEAKEASVNFNRKGKGSPTWDAIFAFFNVAQQSLQKNAKLAKDYPARFTAVAVSFIMLGFLEALMNYATDDDDPEDNYYNINPYMRENYLVLPNLPRILQGKEKGSKYLSIPLPQFWRAFKSIGSIAFDVFQGKMTAKKGIAAGITNFAASLTPFDIGGFFMSGKPSMAPLMPTILKPVYEIATNTNYMGYKIAKEPFTKTQERQLASSELGKNNVNPAIKFFTDLFFRWGGGDNESIYKINKGEEGTVSWWADWNPSYIEHLFKGYTGGTGAVVSDLMTTISQLLTTEKEVDFKNVPFVNKFIRETPEAKWNIISEYYSLKDPAVGHGLLTKKYEQKAYEGKGADKLIQVYGAKYYDEYKNLWDTYDNIIKETSENVDFNTVEGSKQITDQMEIVIKKIKDLKEKYKK